MLPQCCYLRRRRAERRKEKDPPKCSTLSRKKKECFGAQGARLELLTTQTLNQEGGSARREALRADKRQRKAASDAKIIWTGWLPHLSGLPHLPGVPYLRVNRPLLLRSAKFTRGQMNCKK